AELDGFEARARLDEAEALPGVELAVEDADVGHHALEHIVLGIEHHGAQGCLAVALGRWDASYDRLEDVEDADAALAGGEQDLVRVEADEVLDLLADALGVRGGEVDLVDDR